MLKNLQSLANSNWKCSAGPKEECTAMPALSLSSASSLLASAMMLSRDLLVMACRLEGRQGGREEGGRGKGVMEAEGKGVRGRLYEGLGGGCP